MTQELHALEKSAINTLFQYLDTFKKFERPLSLLMKRKYSPEEILEAEGKRCIITVSGLRYHELVLYFQINGLSIVQVPPYEGSDTYVQVTLGTVNRFLKEILSGNSDAFGDLVTEEGVKFRGKRTLHDMTVFQDACETLARNIRRLKEAGM